MDRDQLEKIFYGESLVPPPWSTDCPVRFDVWLAFSAEPLHARVDVILEVNEEHGITRVLDQFERLQLLGSAQPIAAGSFIAARLRFHELIRGVLPMTNLYALLRIAKDRPDAELEAATGDAGSKSILSTAATVEEPGREDEHRRHLTWLLRLLVAVVESAMTPPKGRESAAERKARHAAAVRSVVSLIRDVSLEPRLTRLPHAPGNEVIDRRRRFPITSVTTSRRAGVAVTRSRRTVKADAAEAVFYVDCRAIGWAVVDSGIDAQHPAFQEWNTSVAPPTPWPMPPTVVRAFNFMDVRQILFADRTDKGLIDWVRALPYLEMLVPGQEPPSGGPPIAERPVYTAPLDAHGTHIAGIIGGLWPDRDLRGMCPGIRLYDFRVLDASGEGDEFSVVMALQAIRHINEQAGRLAIAGVNLSLAVPHDVATHSCGWTPVCIEADRLTRSGVVVVASAGNTGFTGSTRTTGASYHTVSISDPGNADNVITVGSTHRTNPHRHGVSYFSSRGPTADGRMKPDLVAPGEDIDGPIPGNAISAMHGTSQAAAHVSGAAAMLIGRHRELLGRPERVKDILCSTATDLGRERSFQGHGLVDVLRAIQSV